MYGEAVPCEGDHLAQLSLQEVDSLAAGQSTEGGALPGQRDGFAALGIELEPLGKIEGRAVLLLKVEKYIENFYLKSIISKTEKRIKLKRESLHRF